MSDIVKPLPYSVDLSKPLDKTDLHTLFVMGDNQAHRFELEILSGSKAVDLTGATVTGYFTNFKEDTTVEVAGKVEGGKAVVVLSKPCYTLHGQFVLSIQVKIGEVEDTVFLGEGFMRRTKGETIIYDDYIVYDVSTLLAQISAMKTATENANKAAADANAAAEHAPYVDGATGYWMYWDVGAGKYVSTGTPATGPQGAAGNDGADGETPYIGSNGNWWIGQTDTGVKAQGPAGQNGTGSGTVTGVKIGENTYAPDSSGLVDLSGMTAPDADKLNGKSADQYMLKTDTAADSAKLDGKDSVYYLGARNLLDNSDFRNLVNQRGATYVGTTWAYFIDRWVGNASETAYIWVNADNIALAHGTNIVQPLPNDRISIDKQYTIAIETDSGMYTASGFVSSNNETSINLEDGVWLSLYSVNDGNWYVRVGNKKDSGDIVVYNVALYEGEYTADNLPPYVPKENEIVACLQYAYIPMNSQFAIPVSLGGYTSITFPFKMRETPNIELELLNGVEVTIVEQNQYGVVFRNDSGSTSQFRFKAFADL